MEQGPVDLDGYGKDARCSFFKAETGSLPELKDAEAMLSGPLVKTFTVAGMVQGQKRAVYISPNSYVERVNFIKGAAISGDIISDYDNLGRGNTRATDIYVGGISENFETPDPDFQMTISGKILGSGKVPKEDGNRLYIGRGLINLILVGGITTIPDSGRIDVSSVNISPGAVLEIKPDLANLRPIFLEANTVVFSPGSIIRISESTSLRKGNVSYFTPLLKVTNRGSANFVNEAILELAPDSSLKDGTLIWYSSGSGDHLLVYVNSEDNNDNLE
jgi:hypothetical protein